MTSLESSGQTASKEQPNLVRVISPQGSAKENRMLKTKFSNVTAIIQIIFRFPDLWGLHGKLDSRRPSGLEMLLLK